MRSQVTIQRGYDAELTAAQNIPFAGGAWQIWQTNKTIHTVFLLNAILRCD